MLLFHYILVINFLNPSPEKEVIDGADKFCDS